MSEQLLTAQDLNLTFSEIYCGLVIKNHTLKLYSGLIEPLGLLLNYPAEY